MLFIAFIAFLAVEALAIYTVAQWIGGLYVLALMALGAICGVALINRQSEKAKAVMLGRAAPDNITFGGQQSALNSLFTFLAGILLVFPGFVSDVIALLLLFPPFQVIIAAFLGQYLAKKASSRFQAFYFGGFGGPSAPGQGDDHGGARVYRDKADDDGVIEGEFREIDPEEVRRREEEGGTTFAMRGVIDSPDLDADEAKGGTDASGGAGCAEKDGSASGHAREDSDSSGR